MNVILLFFEIALPVVGSIILIIFTYTAFSRQTKLVVFFAGIAASIVLLFFLPKLYEAFLESNNRAVADAYSMSVAMVVCAASVLPPFYWEENKRDDSKGQPS